MKKNRLIASIMILTMVLTSGLGNLGMMLSSYAQDKSSLIIKDIINEEPTPTPDSKYELNQNIEKISDTEIKINLSIKGLSQNIDLNKANIQNTLSDNFEIESDKVSVVGISDSKNVKGEVTQPRDTISISLDNLTSDEVKISFMAKIRNGAKADNNVPVNIKSELKYELKGKEEVYKFPNPKISLGEVESKDNRNLNRSKSNSTKKSSKEVRNGLYGKKTLDIGNLKRKSRGTIQTHKSVEENSNGTYKINLEVKGTPSVSDPKDADIVLVLDTSGSMIDKAVEVKTAAKNFSENILRSSSKDQVRISVATFDYTSPGTTVGESSKVVTEFTSDISTINTEIDSIRVGGGTHTQDGIWRATDLLSRSRKGANRYVVFFSDGAPNQSYSAYPTGHDMAFKDAQREYYKNFIGYGAPTQVSIGGLGYHENGIAPLPETISVNNNPIYKDVKFYSLGLFSVNGSESKETGINFLKTIQNVIEPSKFGEKYFTQDLNAIDDIFMDISHDIKSEISDAIAKDLVIHDIVTKEFNIVKDSFKLHDLNGNEIPLPNESVIVSKTADGCDEITVKVGNVLTDINNIEGGVRLSFDIATKDPYFSGNNIKTNVGADITYKEPIIGSEPGPEISKDFIEDPAVNIKPKNATIKITKNVVNNSGQIITDDTPFDIVIERVKGKDDPANIVDYNKTYKLKSKEFNDTGVKHLIGPNTVSADGKLILSTDTINKDNYLIAGQYIVKEINIPSEYVMKQIKVNGQPINVNNGFNLSKDNPNINIEVVNSNSLAGDLLKNKTATEVKDENGNPTGEYEIALNVKTSTETPATIMHDSSQIKYYRYHPYYNQYYEQAWESRTIGSATNAKTYQYTNNNSDYIQFTFTGTGFDLVSMGNVGEYIDGSYVDIGSHRENIGRVTFSSNGEEKVVYSKRDLPYGTHTVTIQHFNKDSSTKNILSIRKLQIYKEPTTNSIINNAVINDVVTEHFNVVKDGYGVGKTAVIEKPSGSAPIDIATTIGTKVINGKTYESLSWSPISIDSNGVTVKFKVKPKDPYFGGSSIHTNVEATVEYNKNGINNKEVFNKPTVNIPYKKGNITIIKEIVAKSQVNPNVWEVVPNDKINQNDTFSISIVGDQKYTADIKGNSQSSMSFYLKDKTTDISNNADTSLNYLTIGSFSINEVVPMNYKQVQIWVDSTPGSNTNSWVKIENYVNDKVNIDSGKVKDGKIVIDKDNPNMRIKVSNTLVNNKYWQDKANALNKFNYQHNPNPGLISRFKSSINKYFK